MQITNNLLSAGLGAYQAGQQRVEAAAGTPPVAENSQAVTDTVELTEQLIQMKVGEHIAKAGAPMLQSADEVLGTLIHTQA
ncbi:MAG TPA: hypothetical protein DHV63_02595 [Pseudomonas sp.]|nr:hypothetical protein [Pseudomonas sp.]